MGKLIHLRMPSCVGSCLLITLVLLVLHVNSQIIPCAHPCVPEDNQCQISTCNLAEGICVDTPKPDLPEGCCVRNSDCPRSTQCTLYTCNLRSNRCGEVDICITQPTTCTVDNDCIQPDTCALYACVSGTCQSTQYHRNNPGCCSTANDCAERRCKHVTCNDELKTCIYQNDPECTYYSDSLDGSYETLPGFVQSSSSEEPPGVQEDQEDVGLAEGIMFLIGAIILAVLISILFALALFLIVHNLVRSVE